MARQNSNREPLSPEEIQRRKRRRMQRERERRQRERELGIISTDSDALTESQRERLEYRERQRKREARMRREREKRGQIPQSRTPRNQNPNQLPKGKKQQKKKRKKSTFGMVLLVIQIFASIVFMISLKLLDILPGIYLAAIIAVLFVFAFIVWFSQLRPKKRGVLGKLFSIFLSFVLLVSSYYIVKTNGLLSNVFGNTTTTSTMVVAVLKDDPAESIQDTADYIYGVQYATGGDNVEKVVQDIEVELNAAIEMTEYDSVQEQAQGLIDGEVDAIIYGSGYTSLMQDAVSGYSNQIKIIYTDELENSLENTTSSVAITEPFSVYISGIDVYGDVSQDSRSDVNIIATVNPKTHQVLLTSTPRDFYVVLPGVSDGQYDKLTHAGIYGVETSMATLEHLYDMNIDFYARLNFTSLINIVDQLGGIDVYSEYTFTTSEDSGCVIDIVEGYNTLNGEEALAFARERQNVPGGDNQRGKDQQAVITAMIKKMLSPMMLIQASGMIDNLSGNIQTNMSLQQMHGLVKSQLRTNAKWSIASVEPEGYEDNQYCYSVPESPLYVTVPDDVSVANIAQTIQSVVDGQALTDAETVN